jgi:hypothetical protein
MCKALGSIPSTKKRKKNKKKPYFEFLFFPGLVIDSLKLSFGELPIVPAGLEITYMTQAGLKLTILLLRLQVYHNTQLRVWFLLHAYHFPTTAKLKTS